MACQKCGASCPGYSYCQAHRRERSRDTPAEIADREEDA
jgi:hypothetical protein